ncbi:MAG: hypothetical protein K2J32_03800 [Ruminococcus sp.]|nr:hypothetical protein [Ruminococcus sp.]
MFFSHDFNQKIKVVTEKDLLAEKEKQAGVTLLKHKPVCDELKMISGIKKTI